MIPISQPTRTRKGPRRSAFSLIEVTVSLGIIGTGMLLLVGLMPYGVKNLSEASSRSMERRISQNIISEMLLHEWSQLHHFNSEATGGAAGVGVRYFDNHGIELSAVQKDEAIFRVRVRVVPRDVRLDHQGSAASSTASYSLPDDTGAATAAGTVANLRRVHVDITSIPIPFFDVPSNFGTGSDARVRTYTSIISNMQSTDQLPPVGGP